ncbi:hypothetical protein ACFQX6_47170 [Streptosporangium lutulentum]
MNPSTASPTASPTAPSAPRPTASPSEESAGPSAGPFAGLAGTRVRDGITAYRLDPHREVFVLDSVC